MSLHELFNEDYYENGVKKKVSGYEDYRWMPTRSIPEALEIKNNFNFINCVDYGCAKGFLVHALRLVGCEAYGEDLSEYALKNCYPEVKSYLSFPNNKKYDLLVCKDVLEHVPEQDLQNLLTNIKEKADEFFFVVPFGDNEKFRIREYEIDITHVTKKDEEWWFNLFKKCGFKIKNFSYSFGAIKEKWIEVDKFGNGFFILTK